jgi:GT2 family glycosyltransferase
VERGNKSHALNKVLETLDDGLALFLDDDVRLSPGTLCAYAEASSKADTRTFFGGPTGVDYEEEPGEWIKAYLPTSARGWHPQNHQEAREGSFLGFNWAAFVSSIKQTGGFNENRGPGTISTGQENEMQRRLRKAGLQPYYVPDALVWHYVPQDRCSPAWIIDRAYKHGIAKGRYIRSRTHQANAAWMRLAKRWGYHAIVTKDLVESLVRAELATLQQDERKRFHTRYKASKQKGVMKGYLQNGHGELADGRSDPDES